jgi:Histidine kinase-, DNA gyrase B-, and HSP90-like ATPase
VGWGACTLTKASGVLFDERFLDLHAGSIISDTSVAIVELVANAWDAYATDVYITWPNQQDRTCFSIVDNGKGMTPAQFDKRWRKIDYNKLVEEGAQTDPPSDLKGHPQRKAYGRNGRGRHAGFRFSDPYTVRTWCDGTETTYEVRRGTTQPFDVKVINTRSNVPGHGTEIAATAPHGVVMPASEAREIIGTRFLADPSFRVSVDGLRVTFEDVPSMLLSEVEVPVEPFGTAHLIIIDTAKADRTTRQHGIAWRVKTRLVGNQGWVGFDDERILDGRTTEAKRFQIIVSADFLEDHVLPDWSAFIPSSDAWQATRSAVHSAVKAFLSTFTAERRSEAKATIRHTLVREVSKLSPAGRDRWNEFVEKVIDDCPSISTHEVEQVAGILAKLELSTSRYGLIHKLHEMPSGDLDQLNQLLADWTVRTARIALDEIQTRLKLIQELDTKLRDDAMDEVADLQPLFESSLWVFGPEFESIEFTSNKGMTEVIRKMFGSPLAGSRNRPDFVMVPDGSVGFYSRDAYDTDHEVGGVSRLVVAEIKKVGVTIGSEQKVQAWKYVRELMGKGLLTEASTVTCFVLGSKVEPTESGETTHSNGRVTIRAMAYEVFIRRAEQRMLGLRNKLRDAPFLQGHDLGGDQIARRTPHQPEMDLLSARGM